MNCRMCRASLRPGARFCSNCGRKLGLPPKSQAGPRPTPEAVAAETMLRPRSLKLEPLRSQGRSFFPIILVLLTLAAIVIGAGVAFGPYFSYTADFSEPPATIRSWATAVKEASPAALAQCYRASRQAEIMRQDPTRLTAKLKELNRSLIKLDIIETRTTGRTARVIVTVVGRGADNLIQAQAQEVPLIQENGQWKLDSADSQQPATIIEFAASAEPQTTPIDSFGSLLLFKQSKAHYFNQVVSEQTTNTDAPQSALGLVDGRYAVVQPGGELVLGLSEQVYFRAGLNEDIRVYGKNEGQIRYQAWVSDDLRRRWHSLGSPKGRPGGHDLIGAAPNQSRYLKLKNLGEAPLAVDAVEAFYLIAERP